LVRLEQIKGWGTPVRPAVSPHAFNDLGLKYGGLDIFFNPELFSPQNLKNEKIQKISFKNFGNF